MKEELQLGIVGAIQSHPEILQAAITGSQARHADIDQYSDLDLLLVARDVEPVRNVRSWFPRPESILICEFHLTRYCTILLNSFEKIDLAIFSVDDPSSWVVHDYKALKGDAGFEARLAMAAADTRNHKAVHLNPDVNIDNVLLLLVTALHRVGRGEKLSAHAFVSMASDMVISLEKPWQGTEVLPDLLDPRRRLERGSPKLAQVLDECLFSSPDRGIKRLAQYLSERHRDAMVQSQREVLKYLWEQQTIQIRDIPK
jgi:hypothetical protein